MKEPTKAEILRCADKILKGHTHGFYDVAGTKLCMMDTEEWESLMALRVKMYEEPPAKPATCKCYAIDNKVETYLCEIHGKPKPACPECKGTGLRENSKDQECECVHCDGTGKPSAGWPTVEEIKSVAIQKTRELYYPDGKTKYSLYLSNTEWDAIVKAIHAAFTKSLHEKGIL